MHHLESSTVGSLYKATLYKAHFFTENRPVDVFEIPHIRHNFSGHVRDFVQICGKIASKSVPFKGPDCIDVFDPENYC